MNTRVKLFFRFVLISLGLLSIMIFMESLLYIARQETVILNSKRIAMLCIIPGLILYTYFVYFVFKCISKMNKIHYKRYIYIMSSIILAIQLLFLFVFTDSRGITDTYSIIDEAMSMFKNNTATIGINKYYFSKYGNNNFLTLIFYGIYRFTNKIHGISFETILSLLNLLCIDTAIVYSIKIAKKMRGNLFAIKVLLLIMLCPTTYVWLTFTYSNTISMPFMMAALYYGYSALESRKNIYIIVSGIILGIGYKIRPTTIIPFIAICIVGILYCKKDTYKKKIIILALLVATFVITTLGISGITNKHVDEKINNLTFPYTHWIMMGLKDQGYVNTEDVDFTRSYKTKEEKKNANIKEIKKRIKNLGPVGYGVLVANKLEAVWGIGTDDYQAFNFNGEHISNSYKYIYGDKNGLFLIYCQVFRAFTFLFLIASILSQLKIKEIDLRFLLSITLLGAIIFFIIWEANKKYSICFINLLVLLTVDGLMETKDCIINKLALLSEEKTKKLKKIYQVILSVIPAILAIFMVIDAKYYVHMKYEYHEPAVIVGYNINKYYELKKDSLIQQTFQTSKAFNKIEVLVKEDKLTTKQDNYLFELYDENNNRIVQRQFSGKAVNGENYCVIPFEKVNSNGKNKTYTFKISCLGKQDRWISFGYTNTMTNDPYRYGELEINNNVTNTDLVFSVLLSKQESYSELLVYGIICIVILLGFVRVFKCNLLRSQLFQQIFPNKS